MTVEAMLPYNHSAPPVKTESDRTESPVVLQSNPMQDYAASPVATSYSSSRASNSPTLSSDHHYNHHPHHHHIPSSSRMQPTVVHGQKNPPVPVRSASWAAGGAAGSPQNVPTVITTKAGSTPNFTAAASGSTSKNPNAANTTKVSSKTVQVPAKKKQNAKNDKKSGDTVTARRQKRLERNRESARLSRRRRKQYLEVLEDRVKQLSIEMDSGRRKHAAVAIETIAVKREEVLSREPTEQCLALLDGPLSRTSEELSVLATFNTQQLKSFALPADSKFVLWLTLQGDTYFRGGRAASERLSAARIGERMLNSGNDRVAPTNPMWPLLCNEIGLSYDQEERARNYQRTMLQETNTWLDRHSARSSSLAMQSFHDSVKTVACAVKERDYRTRPLLSESQRLRFLSWAHTNAHRIKGKFENARHTLRQPKETEKFKCSPDYHVAANLYILNDRLQKIMSMFPQNFPVVTPGALKRLSRRPSFESLGQQKEEDGGRGLTRANSFASAGSLKRSSSTLSMGGDMEDDEDKPQPQQVSPEDGEEAAAPAIEKELGFVKEIIPRHIPPTAPPAPAAPIAVTSATAPVYHFSPLPMKQVAPVPVPQSHMSHSTSHPTPIAAHPAHGAQHSMSNRSAPVAPEPYSLAPPHYPSPYAQAQYYQQYPGQSSAYSHAQTGHHYHQPPQQPVLAPAPPPPPRVVASQAPGRNQKTPPSHPPQHARQPSSSPQAPSPSSSGPSSASGSSHQRKSSFLPPHLNVVPEEMFPATEGSDDFFMSLMDDEDWAIGGGVDMDTSGS